MKTFLKTGARGPQIKLLIVLIITVLMGSGIANGQHPKSNQIIGGCDMSFRPQQLRELITEVLVELDLYSADACELLLLTAAQESHLGTYLKQVGNGPAKGIFQCEGATEKDIWKNFLKYKPELKKRVAALVGEADWEHLQLTGNLLYQIAICRIHYLRCPEVLPDRNDIQAMAKLWKKRYNTYLGKGTVNEAIENYKRYVLKQ